MKCVNRSLWLLVLAFILTSTRSATLFPAGSEWKWRKGTSEASQPATAWREIGFVDSAWSTAPAPFFYGENLTPGTVITDMGNNYSSIYFRKTFTIPDLDAVAGAELEVLCDDGFIAWINGHEVGRKLAPANPLHNAFATDAAPEPVQFERHGINNPQTVFRQGENVIAVHGFNVSLSSSDFVFDARLTSIERETEPPVILSANPFPGQVTNLTEITITFSEPVQGVDAGDMRVNDTGAQTVTGSGAIYTFRFAQPAFGPVRITWAPDSFIYDLALPPNPFDPAGPGARIDYELVDATFPLIAAVHPPAGAALRQLREIEIFFTKSVEGVSAGALLINGAPATTVAGTGAGPYRFTAPVLADGPVELAWNPAHEITDLTEERRRFEGDPWSYTLEAERPVPGLIISEISAANMNGLRDADGSNEDWIELHNPTEDEINLHGWSLTDDEGDPGQWVFPPVTVAPGGYLVVFASGKDRRTLAGDRLHTNFKLGVDGEYLALFTPDSPRIAAFEFADGFPEQRNDYSYGVTPDGTWKYFAVPTPGRQNGNSTIIGITAPVEFTARRGFYTRQFPLQLHSPSPNAVVRYTLDGREPTATTGIIYTNAILIDRTRIVRAAAFQPNHLPSRTETHTFLYNIPPPRWHLPALSLVTATNHLYGPTGIMETNPRNTIHQGMAWEKPVSVEYIQPGDNTGFQINSGLRVHGGGYVRERYNYRSSELPFSKYSYRLYFRGDYGSAKLEYPLFGDLAVTEYDVVVLRAGMNDHTNPFIRDELARALSADVGCVASHGTFVNLFLNGVYKGIYNPAERIDRRFMRQWHGGGEDWDVIAQSSEVRDGDAVAWEQLKNLVNTQSPAVPATYQEIAKRIDLTNFVDYLLPLIYADTDDWPHNNWRAARERVPGGRFRFYVWDAEWSFGHSGSPSRNTIAGQLSNLSPPWGTAEIQRLFTRLRLSPEFRLLFADRVHKHLFNGGALTDPRVRARYEEIRNRVSTSISGFDNSIGSVFIPQRRRFLTNHLAQANLMASSNAPVFSQFGGLVPAGFELGISSGSGTIYYTTNGVDPRVAFTGEPHPDARISSGGLEIQHSLQLKARTLVGSNWSALTEAAFEVERLGSGLRITEIMYNPIGGQAFEFLELHNIGGGPANLGGLRVAGIDFQFPGDTPPLAPGDYLVLASGVDPALFAQRYPGVAVAGYFQGALSNGGELIEIKDPRGAVLTQVDYKDDDGWPLEADGAGFSLEIIDPAGDPSSAANWQASIAPGGTPGRENSKRPASPVRISEVMAENVSAVQSAGAFPDWVEIENTSESSVSLANWSLTDDSQPRKFVFPAGTVLPAGGRLVVWCGGGDAAGGLRASFALNKAGEHVFLHDAVGNRVDGVTFGRQLADYSIGRDESGRWVLTSPTPNAPNQPAPVAPASSLKLNELLANPGPAGEGWIEIYNSDLEAAAALGGYYLGASGTIARLPALSFVEAGGYAVWLADAGTERDSLPFRLRTEGGTLTLHAPAGVEIDRVTYVSQPPGAGFGRLPDGTEEWIAFPVSPSPGAANYLPDEDGPRLNEVLARNRSLELDGTARDWIELWNPAASDFSLAGMSLSINQRQPGQWRFADGLSIPAGGYFVISCAPGGPAGGMIQAGWSISPGLEDESGGVYLFNSAGQLMDMVEYGYQVQDHSIGRTGSGWRLLSEPTPGAPNSEPAALGEPGGLRINEWLAAPMAGEDWLEIYNSSAAMVELSGLYLTDDPSWHGRTNTQPRELSFIAPQGFALVRAEGRADLGGHHANFRLSAQGELLRLYSSTFAVIDEVLMAPQLAGVSEGRVPDGGDAIMSFPGGATPGASNMSGELDSDGDGMPDAWELARGLDPFTADGHLDLDGDGMTNLEEYLAGTDPADAASSLRLEAIAENGSLTLNFNQEAGRTYTIYYREELGEGDWTRLTDLPAALESGPASVPDLPASAARFYRIITPAQP